MSNSPVNTYPRLRKLLRPPKHRRPAGPLVLKMPAFVTICLLTSWPSAALLGRDGSQGCPNSVSPEYVPSSDPTAELLPADPHTTNPPPINFGTSRSTNNITPYRFKVVNGEFPDVRKLSWDLNLAQGNKLFPEKNFGVTFSKKLDHLVVGLCVNGDDVPEGAYTGTLTIAGDSLKPAQLQIAVNLKYANRGFIVFGQFVTSLAAIFFKWWTVRVADTGQGNSPSPSEFVAWLKSQWITVGLAVLGAAGGVYVVKYRGVEAFKSSDLFAFWGATFTAVTSAALFTNSIGKALTTSNDPRVKKAVIAAKRR